MDFKQIFEQLGSHYSAADFERNTRRIYELEKRVCHSDFDASTAYIAEELRKAGFEQVERIEHPADGVTCVNDSVMPEAWDLEGRAYLKVLSPWPEDQRIIADSDEIAYSAATWSGPTPDEGSTGELIEYDPTHMERMKGRWVLYNGMPTGAVNQPLAQAGALGIVATDFEQGWHDADSTRWMNGQGSWGWYYLKGEARLPIFIITARRAFALKNELKMGHKVVLEGVLKARIYDGKIYTVTGVIPGESSEEYGLFAHMYEPFMSDDASGVAAGIEIGRMIKNSGLKLKKSLRAVFSFEHYGFVFYLSGGRHKLKAAMNLDMISTVMYRDFGFPMHWRLSTFGMPFFGDILMMQMIREVMPELRIDPTYGTLSDDTMGGDILYGVPTNWLYVENTPSPLHHSSSAIFAEVDWDLAESASKLVALLAAFLICGEAGDYRKALPGMCKIAAERASDYRFDTPFERKVRCDFAVGQLKSIEQWMPGVITDDEAEKQIASCRLPDDELPIITDNEKTAAGMIITRFEPGTTWCLNKVPYAERSYCGGRINKLYYSYLDGKVNLLEAIRMADVGLARNTSDEEIGKVIDFMRYLEKYGYLAIENKIS
ncbi:MAG: Zn-dependent exopeptidase M28 [Lentisphaerae bacterium]|nr:Zn-dependent exopeptidase M28 [Lentisphaerota bacterium]